MIKLESIKISINWKELFKTNHEEVREIKEKISNYIQSIIEQEVDVSMITIEKNISEILYEDVKFRVVSTKHCEAIVQIKKTYKDDKKQGYTWKDYAYFSKNDKEKSFKAAMNEIRKLSVKRKYKSRRSVKKQEYLENMPEADKALLRKLLGK